MSENLTFLIDDTAVEWEEIESGGWRAYLDNLTFYIEPMGFSIDDNRCYQWGIEIDVEDSCADLVLGESTGISIEDMKNDIHSCFEHNSSTWLKELVMYRLGDFEG